jgi:hypothetical protein
MGMYSDIKWIVIVSDEVLALNLILWKIYVSHCFLVCIFHYVF